MINQSILDHAESMLAHLYITPLEKCNLCCKMCYTAKSSDILTPEAILDFISRYRKAHKLSLITFCGGEVMLLRTFPALVNQITSKDILVQIITNGTADRLKEFTHPNLITTIVSLDGLESYHDSNRGPGNFVKSLAFLKKALQLGFHIEVFSIATAQNIPDISKFEAYLSQELGFLPDITYHPRKPLSYLENHPLSNQVGTIPGFDFPPTEVVNQLARSKNVFPSPALGCYQLALMSDGRINACCEGVRALGTVNSDVKELIANFYTRLEEWSSKYPDSPTLGCTEPDFLCGLKGNSYVQL